MSAAAGPRPLSNRRNDIELDDATGNRVDSVQYADEGDWAIRLRTPPDYGHRGWTWFAEHDGLGKSLELINLNLPNNHGQNWAASLVAHGTPGAVNSVAQTNVAPLIVNVQHLPPIPRAVDSVLVTARLLDEPSTNLQATLFWRLDSAGTHFTNGPMFDDGLHSDGVAGDGVFAATIPPQINNAVIEFYVQATDPEHFVRTWPASAMETNGASLGQAAIALFITTNGIAPVVTITGEPRSPTPTRSATLTIGGEGVGNYRFSLNGGAFGAANPVAAPILLSNLPHGSTNTVRVVGADSNGVWQSVADATVSRSWIVDTNWPTVRINEVLARNVAALNHYGTFPDAIELHNEGSVAVDLSGLRLTDSEAAPNKSTLSQRAACWPQTAIWLCMPTTVTAHRESTRASRLTRMVKGCSSWTPLPTAADCWTRCGSACNCPIFPSAASMAGASSC